MKTEPFEAGFQEELSKHDGRWSSLAPFFESHGYHLYSMAPDKNGYSSLPPSDVPSSKDRDPADPYPYARRPYKDEEFSITFATEPVCAPSR